MYMCMPKTIIRLYIRMIVLNVQCVLVPHDCFAISRIVHLLLSQRINFMLQV